MLKNPLICGMNTHEHYMQRCLELAAQGLGAVSPNPMVGCVIVCDDHIIGEGYHHYYGGPHAEVNAIDYVLANHANADELLKQSTLYVNLEPCAHFGKTPPCSQLIVKHQIPKVVVGCRDSFAEVNGKGISCLKHAGIEVIEGVLESESLTLNKRFFTGISKQRPYIILKWAQTANGFMAPETDSQEWISGREAKELSHRWRSEEDAVLVGYRTALIDDPQLNVREWNGRNPVRAVIDRDLNLPKTLHVFDQSQQTLIFNALKTEFNGQVKYLELENFDTLLPQSIAYQLYLLDIQSIMIEGGAKTLELFIRAGLWDEARVFTAPKTWESGQKAPELGRMSSQTIAVGADQLEIYYRET